MVAPAEVNISSARRTVRRTVGRSTGTPMGAERDEDIAWMLLATSSFPFGIQYVPIA